MGTCIAAGQGMNPARQVAILGGLAQSTHALTINEACASGLRALMLADQIIRVGDAGVVIAGRHGEHQPASLSVAQGAAKAIGWAAAR